jgi:hypothetical protein
MSQAMSSFLAMLCTPYFDPPYSTKVGTLEGGCARLEYVIGFKSS